MWLDLWNVQAFIVNIKWRSIHSDFHLNGQGRRTSSNNIWWKEVGDFVAWGQGIFVFDTLCSLKDDGRTIGITSCPTKEMVSDYLSKPLHDSLFQLHCNTQIGITLEQTDQYKLEYIAAKIAKAATFKMKTDHLSVWKDDYDQDIYIYLYIYISIYTYTYISIYI